MSAGDGHWRRSPRPKIFLNPLCSEPSKCRQAERKGGGSNSGHEAVRACRCAHPCFSDQGSGGADRPAGWEHRGHFDPRPARLDRPADGARGDGGRVPPRRASWTLSRRVGAAKAIRSGPRIHPLSFFRLGTNSGCKSPLDWQDIPPAARLANVSRRWSGHPHRALEGSSCRSPHLASQHGDGSLRQRGFHRRLQQLR